MLMGAVVGFMIAFHTDSLIMGFIAAIVAGALMSLLFALVTMNFYANQVATGLALTILGVGLSGFIGRGYVGEALSSAEFQIPLLSSIPFFGKVFFSHDALVYVSIGLAIAVYWFFKSTRAGLIVKAVGESPESAQSLGLSVLKVRYMAIVFGGSMAGLAGGYLSLIDTPLWAENMTAGRGWIALALVVFASWRVERAVFGAYLFGLMSIMHLVLQSFGLAVSSNLLATLPYVATVVVLVLLSRNQQRIKLFAPMSLGKSFHGAH